MKKSENANVLPREAEKDVPARKYPVELVFDPGAVKASQKSSLKRHTVRAKSVLP